MLAPWAVLGQITELAYDHGLRVWPIPLTGGFVDGSYRASR
jgi:hypothetical protein